MQKLKSEKGFTAVDGTIAVIIIMTSLLLLATMLHSIYLQALATERNALATFYAVEVLERIEKMDYNDSYLQAGTLNTETVTEGGDTYHKVMDILLDSNYTVTLTIEKYEPTANAQDLVKRINVNVSYEENSLTKNISISTLKLNM